MAEALSTHLEPLRLALAEEAAHELVFYLAADDNRRNANRVGRRLAVLSIIGHSPDAPWDEFARQCIDVAVGDSLTLEAKASETIYYRGTPKKLDRLAKFAARKVFPSEGQTPDSIVHGLATGVVRVD